MDPLKAMYAAGYYKALRNAREKIMGLNGFARMLDTIPCASDPEGAQEQERDKAIDECAIVIERMLVMDDPFL